MVTKTRKRKVKEVGFLITRTGPIRCKGIYQVIGNNGNRQSSEDEDDTGRQRSNGDQYCKVRGIRFAK